MMGRLFTLWSPLHRFIRAIVGTGSGINMLKSLRGLGFLILALTALALPAMAQSPPVPPATIPNVPNQPPPAQMASPPATPQTNANPVCTRLESQLAVVNRGATDPARVEAIKRLEDAVAKQQAAFDQMMQLRTEQEREANAIREFGLAQQKKENDFLTEYIPMI